MSLENLQQDQSTIERRGSNAMTLEQFQESLNIQ
jgi:hypothetical protein